ncbi:flavin reductase family protein [Bacillus sp. V59.32b]|uniref:flavin reductase family protein n=1 Tax=Bacillus sp. V59.32b TaxID=1758642 RepID=UPI0020B17135|nr:flavin reductase family protein [Bacillus sp. V59.32b]
MKRKTFNHNSRIIEPKILYYGTPVVLLTTLNEDGSTNISPISSSWALGDCIILGIGIGGKAFDNLKRTTECVINVPNKDLWANVEKLAPYTGKEDVPDYKKDLGFTFQREKYTVSGLTPLSAEKVQPDRIDECPIQIEATVKNLTVPGHSPYFAIVETKSLLVHAHENILMDDKHIDPNKWNPLIYSFRHYFGLGQELGKTFRAQ